MRRVMFFSGIALMVFAFVILTVFIILPAVISPLDDAPLLKGILQSLLCNSNEVLTARYSTYNTPTSTTRSTDMKCVDREQNARDVSQQGIGIGAVGYLVPFLVGLFATLLAKPPDKRLANLPTRKNGINFADREADHLAQLTEASEKAKAGMGMIHPLGQVHSQLHDQPDHLSLAQRLRELKEAHQAGLITESEYEAKRKELLEES